MHHGNLTNIQILELIASGMVAFGDTVFSSTWGETLIFNGVVFKSACTCEYVGNYPQCEFNDCPPVLELIGSFQELAL